MDNKAILVKKKGLYRRYVRKFRQLGPISGLYVLMLQPNIGCTQDRTAQVEDPAFQVVINQFVNHTVPELTIDEIKPHSYVYLDARSYEEYAVSHIPGAIWVGHKDFSLSRLPDVAQDQAVVVYCSIGYRSEKISEQLIAAGYTKVHNLVGGIFEWINEGHEVVDQAGPVKRVHGYSPPFGTFVEDVEVVY